MKWHVFFTLLSVCLLGFLGQADAQSKADCFKMQSTKGVKEIPVEKTFSDSKGDNELKLFDGIEAVYALSVSMDITCLTENFLVRVLLKDAEGRKHLVAESYKEIAPSEKTMLLADYCEETALLGGVKPVSLLVITDNAEVKLSRVRVSTEESHEPAKGSDIYEKRISSLRKQQVLEKVDLINAYNEANNKLWRAGVTDLSLYDYEKKMSMIACPDGVSSQGIEYYSGGIFEFGESLMYTPNHPGPFDFQKLPLKDFDWRNRHGNNWITSIKKQGPYQLCAAFASVGTLESIVQLYYNSIIDSLNLSEWDATVNHGQDPLGDYLYGGMDTREVVQYIANHGVCDEESYYFDPETGWCITNYDAINPLKFAKANSCDSIDKNVNAIKLALATKGPLVSGYTYGGFNGHAMELIGFGKVEENMTILYHHDGIPIENADTAFVNGNPHVGETFWIFKNSCGEGPNAYMKILYDNLSADIIGPYVLNPPISFWEKDNNGNTHTYSQADIVCEDKDGDGFFYWGIGPTPSNLPSYAMNEPDGDDGNPMLGPIYSDGTILNLNPEQTDTLFYNQAFQWADEEQLIHCYNHVKLESVDHYYNVNPVCFHNGAKIFIENGGELELYKYNLYNAEIIMEPGARLIISHGARVILREGASFNPPAGAIIEIEEGSIEPYSPFSL